MSVPDASSFGSAPFQSRMACLYRAQLQQFDHLLDWSFDKSNRHILPFIGAIRDNCESIALLQQAVLLNELTLINRVFVQRVINCCYLLNADAEIVSKYLAQPTAGSGEQLRDGSPEAFLEFSATYNPSEPVAVLKPTLFDQAEDIEHKTGTPKEVFLVALASVFPKSAEILAGSLFGNTFHFGVFGHRSYDGDRRAQYPSEEISASLLLGIGLLDTLLQIIGKREPIDAIKAVSSENMSAAEVLMKGGTSEVPAVTSYADGAWEGLASLEYSAHRIIGHQLQTFSQIFEDTYEAGLIAPTLRVKGMPRVDARFAAVFFKRVLNDLRGVWELLNKGYTSQAASIAASLYESGLATMCLLHSDENIAAFERHPHGEVPWKIINMAKMVVRAEGKSAGSTEFENSWRALYAHYVWLCQIKHSSRDSVIYDTRASKIEGEGYIVMAMPNVREEDISTKATVAVIALLRTLDCIEAFGEAFGFAGKLPEEYGFAERVRRIRESVSRVIETHGKAESPISIAKSWFAKKYPPIAEGK